MAAVRPFIVGLGGTLRPGSTSERALTIALATAAARGADTRLFAGPSISFAPYDPAIAERSPEVAEFIAALRKADGVIIASPSYHGSISGLVKNALDYVHDMRHHPVALLERHGAAVAVADGDQAETTLGSILHCLRAMGARPLAYGVGLTGESFDGAELSDAAARARLDALARRLVQATRARTAPRPRLLDLTRGTGHG